MNTKKHKEEITPTISNYTSTRIASQDPQVHKHNQRKDTLDKFFPLLGDEVLMMVVFSKMEVLISTSGSPPKEALISNGGGRRSKALKFSYMSLLTLNKPFT